MELKEYHYVYYSYEEWGNGYFGSRTCRCLPEEDVKYFGSFSDKNFKPTQKIILESNYTTRKEAYTDEIILQEYYKVVENPHFANRAYQTSEKFSWKNNKHSELTKQKISLSLKGKKRSDVFIKKCKGRKHNEKTKIKISEAMKNKLQSEETKRKRSESNRNPSEETRRKMSEAHKGKSVSEEVKEKIRQKNKGRKQSEEHKIKKAESTSKHFTLQSPCGKIISGKNISKFCEDNNLNKSNIFNVLSGKRKQHKGWTTPTNNDL